MSQTIEYTISIHEDDDGSMWGQVEELPGCFVSGEDIDEILDAAAEAIHLYLAEQPAPRSEAEVVPFTPRKSKRGHGYAVPEAKILLEA